MARAIDHAHPELPQPRPRKVKPPVQAEPTAQLMFSATGEVLGFRPIPPTTTTDISR